MVGAVSFWDAAWSEEVQALLPTTRHPKRTPLPPQKSTRHKGECVFVVGAGGFGPPKSVTTDLQSAPFGRSGNPPYLLGSARRSLGAGDRSRTNNLLITNQLLCHCATPAEREYYTTKNLECQAFFESFLIFFYFFNLAQKSPCGIDILVRIAVIL